MGSAEQQRRAVIILSGGLDSTTCMGFAQEQGYALYPLSFEYGQRHYIEIEKAKEVARYYGVENVHRIISLGFLHDFGGSALTDDSIDVPDMTGTSSETTGFTASDGVIEEPSIPVTYVPARNLLFLSIATSYAEVIGAEAIYIGVNSRDYSGYPDCRPEFIDKVDEVIALATKAGVEGKSMHIQTPLMHLTKAEIISEGMRMGVPYELTTSCYHGYEAACGYCDSCRLRLKGFAEAGLPDPIVYLNRE